MLEKVEFAPQTTSESDGIPAEQERMFCCTEARKGTAIG